MHQQMELTHFFSCSNYSGDYSGTCTSRHYIRADAIEQVVLLELRRLAAFLRYDEEAKIVGDGPKKDRVRGPQ